MARVVEACDLLVQAVAELGKIGGGSFFGMNDDRTKNADAIKSARALVGRARSLLDEAAQVDSRWKEASDTLAGLPRAIIVEPFGRFEMKGARSIESAGAARDRKALTYAIALIRRVAASGGDASLVNELDRVCGPKV